MTTTATPVESEGTPSFFSTLLFDKRIRTVVLFLGIYIFLVSINLMGAGFKTMKGDSKGFTDYINDPISSFCVGLLITGIIQSSSGTTSILVALTAQGVIPPELAIPAIMGANVGTAVTAIIVSFGHVGRKEEFKRAFSGSLVHDYFNVLAVAILLPIEIAFHPIEYVARGMAGSFKGLGGVTFTSPLKTITEPVVEGFVWIGDWLEEKSRSLYVISDWLGDKSNAMEGMLHWLYMKGISLEWVDPNRVPTVFLILVGVVILFSSMKLIVTCTRLFVDEYGEALVDKYLFKGPVQSFSLGLGLTALVQSSSITTSLIVPLTGAGVLKIRKILPYTIGANIGTTVTAIMAALAAAAAADATDSSAPLILAFSHLAFNIFGGTIVYGIKPLRELSVKLAEKSGEIAAESRKGFIALVGGYVVGFIYLFPITYLFIIPFLRGYF